MTTPAQLKTQVQNTQITTIKDFMVAKRDLIAKALPAHITADRLIAMFTIVIQSNPEIANCSQASLIGALVQTAQLGLIPGNVSHCYYVPFNNKKKDGSFVREVQFILGYKGMVELVNRSKSAAILSTEVVYENDTFSYSLGLNPSLNHTPTDGERGGIKGVYCIAKNLMANEKLFIYLTKEDIEKVRGASKAGNSDYSPWAKWYEEMAKKTAIKRICKLLPLAIDIQKKISTDETVKTQLAPDMTTVKDETNWEEADIITEQSLEKIKNGDSPTPIPTEAPKQAVPFSDLANYKLGDIVNVVGKLESMTTKEVGAKKTKITRYGVGGGFIKKFGDSHFNVGDMLLFINVKVGEFNGEPDYVCNSIDPVM